MREIRVFIPLFGERRRWAAVNAIDSDRICLRLASVDRRRYVQTYVDVPRQQLLGFIHRNDLAKALRAARRMLYPPRNS